MTSPSTHLRFFISKKSSLQRNISYSHRFRRMKITILTSLSASLEVKSTMLTVAAWVVGLSKLLRMLQRYVTNILCTYALNVFRAFSFFLKILLFFWCFFLFSFYSVLFLSSMLLFCFWWPSISIFRYYEAMFILFSLDNSNVTLFFTRLLCFNWNQ